MKKQSTHLGAKRARDGVKDIPPAAQPDQPVAEEFLSWLLNGGTTFGSFVKEYHQKKTLYVPISNTRPATYHTSSKEFQIGWSTQHMLQASRDTELHIGTDVNVVRFDSKLGKRVSYNAPVGTVLTYTMMEEMMASGWSLRFLRPHEHSPQVSKLISYVEEAMSSCGGANSYWTPAGHQGFAPHYDDVDVFLVQLEGTKRWRLYDPPQEVDMLSRHSSEDYAQSDMGVPKSTLHLKAGEVLYMPRGTVHQGDTREFDTHSLHITLSCDQMHTWADLFHSLVNHRIDTLAANNVEWRKALPRNWWDSLGEANSKGFCLDFLEGHPSTATDAAGRTALLARTRQFLGDLYEDCKVAHSIDTGVDVYARTILEKRQPPPLSKKEALPAPVTLTSSVRLASATCARLTHNPSAGEVVVYHAAGNSTICYGAPLQHLRFEDDLAGSIASVLASKGKPFLVQSMMMPVFEQEDGSPDTETPDENRLLVAQALVDAGVLVVVVA